MSKVREIPLTRSKMDREDAIRPETDQQREEEAFLSYLETAGELTRDWPAWKREVLRSWPNSAAAVAEARESERESELEAGLCPNGHDPIRSATVTAATTAAPVEQSEDK